MDLGLQLALLCLAARLLQPPVVPDGHHAEHREEERAAVGQDVPHVRGDEEAGWRDASQQVRGSVHTRPLHGGGTMGHRGGFHRGEQPERALPQHAGHVHQGGHSGQAGDEEFL